MKKIIILILILLFTICISCIALFNLQVSDQCPLEKLLLSETDIPSEWKKSYTCGPPWCPEEGAKNGITIVFENNQGKIFGQDIYPYSNSIEAIINIQLHSNSIKFSKDVYQKVKFDNSKLRNINQTIIFCDVESLSGFNQPFCIALMRKGRFVIHFGSFIGQGNITKEEFYDLVNVIDNKITTCKTE